MRALNRLVSCRGAVGSGGEVDGDIWATGRCACNEVEYSLATSPMITHACHCRDCQRMSGAPFVVNLWIESDRVRLLRGELASVELPSGSPAGQVVHFCPRCGTHVYARYLVSPGDTLFVRGGTLDDPEQAPPDVHIWTRSRRPWAGATDTPSFDRFYDPRAVWPAESLERYRANRNPSRG